MPIDIPVQCRVVAQLQPTKRWGDAGPQYENLLQSKRLVHPADIGKFAVSVKSPNRVHHSFMTPSTLQDMKFWTNGLDGVTTLAQSIQIFDDQPSAIAAALRFRWHEAAIYIVTVDEHREFQVRLVGCMWARNNGVGDQGALSEFSSEVPAFAVIG